MSPDIQEKKSLLRSIVGSIALGPSELQIQSEQIVKMLVELPEYKAASAICIYVSFPSEVDTQDLIRLALAGGKRVAVPVVQPKNRSEPLLFEISCREDIVLGSHGMLEPAKPPPLSFDPQLLELIIVPGIAFDKKGNRLGRGAGHYDKLLSTVHCPGIGLAFEEQIQDLIPVEDHDIRMHKVITPKRVIQCRATVLDGKKIAAEVTTQLRLEAERMNYKPLLAAVLVGDDPASHIYVEKKAKMCQEIGFRSQKFILPKDISEEDLLKLIAKLNNDNAIHGILVQLPIPKHISSQKVIYTIAPEKDVDGLHPLNVGKFHASQQGIQFNDGRSFCQINSGSHLFIPCTPFGIVYILKRSRIPITGKHAVVVGRSNMVGKPVAELLIKENATVTICHSKTDGLADYTRKADILVVATGMSKLITADMVKNGAVVVDVGTTVVNGKLTGDVDFDGVKEIASAITPVPGGVGPMTVAMLMHNTLIAAKLQQMSGKIEYS